MNGQATPIRLNTTASTTANEISADPLPFPQQTDQDLLDESGEALDQNDKITAIHAESSSAHHGEAKMIFQPGSATCLGHESDHYSADNHGADGFTGGKTVGDTAGG